jgi:hypothetical protein
MTAQDYIEMFKDFPVIGQAAFRNMEEQYYSGRKSPAYTYSMALTSAFVWDATPEGAKYWREVQEMLNLAENEAFENGVQSVTG